MKTVPASVSAQYTWVDRSGERRIDFEKAWEDMRAEFMKLAAAEGMNVDEHHTIRMFKDPVTRARYQAHQASWTVQHLG